MSMSMNMSMNMSMKERVEFRCKNPKCPRHRRKTLIPSYPVTCACLCTYQDKKDRGTCSTASAARVAEMREREKWPPNGVGTILKSMAAEIGAKETENCGCNGMARAMNAWGPEGCRKHRGEIAAKLEENAGKLKWAERMTMAVRAMTTSWAAEINPLDLYGSLVDIAIRRAEAMQP